jgi:hypothetical protein
MQPKSDFWQTLHRLADDLANEGSDDPERAVGLIRSLEQMPPPALAASFADLEQVMESLKMLLTPCKER